MCRFCDQTELNLLSFNPHCLHPPFSQPQKGGKMVRGGATGAGCVAQEAQRREKLSWRTVTSPAAPAAPAEGRREARSGAAGPLRVAAVIAGI